MTDNPFALDVASRLGKVTASRVCDVIAVTKSGPSASRLNYMTELLIERLTGAQAESYTNAAMQWGTDNEPKARAVFELLERTNVEPAGFVVHPKIPMAGASPDGLVGADAILEIKCPNSATHWSYLREGRVPLKYTPQIQWQLACTGRSKAHFVSFDPRFPDELIYFHIRVNRDDAYIAKIEEAVSKFLDELAAETDVAMQMMAKEAAE